MENFNDYISLGYICSIPAMITSLRLKKRGYPFDMMGIPAWAVCELFANDFVGFLDPAFVVKKAVFSDTKEEHVVDTVYNARLLPHDASGPRFDKYRSIVLKLVKRLQALCETPNAKVLFIRQEETHTYNDRGKRVDNAQYSERYAQSELHWLKKLSQTLKAKYPALVFKILFMNRQNTFVDVADSIVGIGLPTCDYRDRDVGKKMAANIARHSHFLKENLTL